VAATEEVPVAAGRSPRVAGRLLPVASVSPVVAGRSPRVAGRLLPVAFGRRWWLAGC